MVARRSRRLVRGVIGHAGASQTRSSKMIEPLWLRLVGPLVTTLWVLVQWKRKALTLDFPIVMPLHADTAEPGRLLFRQGAAPGSVQYLTVVLLENSGNQVIEPKDFERPLQ